MSEYFSAPELYVYSSVAWLLVNAGACIAYPYYTLDAVLQNPGEISDLQANFLRAFSVIPIVLAALTLGLNFGVLVPPATTSTSTPNVTAFLSQSAPYFLLFYFTNGAFLSYTQYLFKSNWELMLMTAAFGALATCGVLGMLFAGESRAGKGSGWLFATAQERAERKQRRREKREKMLKKL